MSYILTSFTFNHFGAIIYLPKIITMVLRELKQIGKYLAKVINNKFKSKNTIFIGLIQRFEK